MLVGTLALAACGGSRGTGSLTPVAAPQSEARTQQPNFARVPMTFTVTIPVANSARPRRRSPALLHEQFVASNTQSIELDFYTPNTAHTPTNLLQTSVFGLYGTAHCTQTSTDRVCTETVAVPSLSSGTIDIVARTYDAKLVSGAIPPSAKQLAADDIGDQMVTSGGTIKIALGGVPASIVLTIDGSTIVSGKPTLSIHGVGPSYNTMNVQATDADGNTILTDGYVDANGIARSITVTTISSHATCGSGTLQLGTDSPVDKLVLATPPQANVFFDYGFTANAAPFATAGYCNFVVSAAFPNLATQRGKFVLLGPQFSLYPVPLNSTYTRSEPTGITAGPDGNVWFADTDCCVGKVDVATKAITRYPLPAGREPVPIVSRNGGLWLAGRLYLDEVSTAGAILKSLDYEVAPNQGLASAQMVVSPDGNFWFADGCGIYIDSVSPSGTVHTYKPLTTTPSPEPFGVTVGSDGNMWFTEYVGKRVERISPTGTNAKEFDVGVYPTFIVSGPGSDKNLWFTSVGTISKMIPSGAKAGQVTTFQVPTAGHAGSGADLIAGPGNAIWFIDFNGYIDRIPTNATSGNQIVAVPLTPPSSNAGPYGLTAGPDGAIWFTEYDQVSGQGWIGRLAY